jgi:O-antigen/teichoic acid export membrane protein
MARRLLADSAMVAVCTLVGSVLSYGFSFVLAHQLDKAAYGQIGALLMILLVASIPATAVQAVTARRVARAACADNAALQELAGPLIRWALIVGVVTTMGLAALAPAISAALPAVSVGAVAWTSLSLLPFALISGYLGVAQGACRFTAFSVMFIAMNGAKLIAGKAAALFTPNPGLIMGAMAVSWFVVTAACHYSLRDAVGRPSLRRGLGYVRELSGASWSLGAVLVLSLLDGLLSAHYFSGDELGRYQAGAMFTRAGYFGPLFIAVLAYPKLAVPETRRRALMQATAFSVGVEALIVGCTAVAATPMIRIAFGSKYLGAAAGFDLSSAAWLFGLAGAVQALVQLALLDAVARRSTAIGWLVFAGIALETVVIIGFAHHTPTQLITTAALVGTVTAAVSLTVSAFAKHRVIVQAPEQTGSEYAPAAP